MLKQVRNVSQLDDAPRRQGNYRAYCFQIFADELGACFTADSFEFKLAKQNLQAVRSEAAIVDSAAQSLPALAAALETGKKMGTVVTDHSAYKHGVILHAALRKVHTTMAAPVNAAALKSAVKECLSAPLAPPTDHPTLKQADAAVLAAETAAVQSLLSEALEPANRSKVKTMEAAIAAAGSIISAVYHSPGFQSQASVLFSICRHAGRTLY